MEFRRLNNKEAEKVNQAIVLIGGTLTGSSYVSGTYYIGIFPKHQATPRFRRTLEGALGTDRIVLNGRVKV